MSPVLRVTRHIYGVSKEIDAKAFFFRVNLVFKCHHFVTDHLQEYVQFTIYQCVGVKGTSAVLWSSNNYCSFSPKYAIWSSRSCTTLKDQQSGLDMERWLTPGEILLTKDLFTWEGNYLVRSFICNMKRPSVKQSMKWQVSSNFQIYLGKSDDEPPPVSHFHDNYRLHFSDFQLYQVTLPIDPPISYCSNSCTLSLLRNIQRPIVK